MKLIPLTKGQVAKVDDDDFEKVSKGTWRAWLNKRTGEYYAMGRVDGVSVYMARYIMDTPFGMRCDHINHDTLNNQRYNLRNCTHDENLRNRKSAQRNSKTGILGVSPNKKDLEQEYLILLLVRKLG